MQRIWKDYFEYLYYIDTQEQFAVHMYDFDEVQRGNYFGGESIRKTEAELTVGKLKNGKAAGRNKVKGDII